MAWYRGYEQHNSWPGSAEEILQRMQDEERLKQSGERFPFEASPNNEPTGWDTINPLGPRSERIEVIPYSEEEANARKWGLLNSFVDMIKRTGGNLMDRYQQNREDRRKWQEENPGGYPGMPQHLKERLRRNQMSSIDGKLVAGYDPDFPSDDNVLREALRGYRRPDGSGPAKLGSDVLDILVRQGRV